MIYASKASSNTTISLEEQENSNKQINNYGDWETADEQIGRLEIIEIEEIEKESDKRVRMGKDLNLDGGIATAVEDLPCVDAYDGSHRFLVSWGVRGGD